VLHSKILSDTHPVMEAKQLELIRQASVGRRLELMRALTRNSMLLSYRAIAAANPGASTRELDLLFVQYHYGSELAEKLKVFLAGRDKNGSGSL
jgi:hypothetical protein